jgi:hypothetical protein
MRHQLFLTFNFSFSFFLYLLPFGCDNLALMATTKCKALPPGLRDRTPVRSPPSPPLPDAPTPRPSSHRPPTKRKLGFGRSTPRAAIALSSGPPASQSRPRFLAGTLPRFLAGTLPRFRCLAIAPRLPLLLFPGSISSPFLDHSVNFQLVDLIGSASQAATSQQVSALPFPYITQSIMWIHGIAIRFW